MGGDVVVVARKHRVVIDFEAHGFWVEFDPLEALKFGELLRDAAVAAGGLRRASAGAPASRNLGGDRGAPLPNRPVKGRRA